ncbi:MULTISPECIES: aldolase catalytic domain-containing protein [Paenibacillus]|jgi:4-hydroxy 2-oxovalerate aldolase|uniref:4-hydroxy 2-oxovalerate aldolase n=2 Tax=Paenibacillus barengoltzii TaxID=343517 RepID=R9LB46_9BACL|nr:MULTISPECIES: aldolase catalytic domain-containing protein [Paenibacillus]EOS55783.1 4-hydroxy 2-oxovalerate aldolase [Paenibacillus barengoltzii G22]MDU0331522.1 aldolase catalytic domain-containing protein [Paenibacillus sp. 3LSP]MEC2345580.1 aldolase catalytic domain-containing protein [Paenibacillus barengoltzii]SMF38692.1 4-hydroxy 2-oxovalerate aldolase [Paenibacillus barengoltzii J12]SMF68641.1 4-hydroxy 2-oxovalerate aldolase [Paenibacillus barengoltzii]
MKANNCKIVDCTIRDGGLVNNWDFSVEFVQKLYAGLNEAGVDYMEIGYKNSPKLLKGADEAGPWRFLDDDFLRKVIPQKGTTKLSALVDIGRVDENDILPRSESVLDLIRVACYIKDVDKALQLVQLFHDRGYETTLNIMALSNVMEHELLEAFEMIKDSVVDVVYIVDSYGSLDYKDMEHLVNKFKTHLPGKRLGVHTHNNMQLAFSNTLVAAENGVELLDASVYGMGRAAGNCPTELLVTHLKGTNYKLRPVLEVLEELLIPLREKEEWGYLIPYMITGTLDEHPRSAMALRASDDKDKVVDFYDKLTTPETTVHRPKKS